MATTKHAIGLKLRWPVVLWLFVSLFPSCFASLWTELERINDLQEWRRIVSEHKVIEYYHRDADARMTVFAPVDDVFLRWPELRSLTEKESLSHISDVRIPEIGFGQKWPESNGSMIIRSTVGSGRVYVVQKENNPGNFSYFANNGRLCNHVSSSWQIVSGNQYMYKICSNFGHDPFPGTALEFIKADISMFQDRRYNNLELKELRDTLYYFPTEATILFGSSVWSGMHTFFLPNNEAFRKVPDRKNLITREVLLAHATMPNRVLFTESWLYDYGVHFESTVRIEPNVIQENYRLKIAIRNITDHANGKWELWAVSEVYERYSQFRLGGVWAKIVVPNIPVTNGVVHVVDSVLGVVSMTIEQIVNSDKRFTTLVRYINEVGMIVKTQLAAQSGLVTFFAPLEEAFDRIPQEVERRLLRDRIWLAQILQMHIVPSKELTTDQINNLTIVNTADMRRQLYFMRGEWPRNNITFYVNGGGVWASFRQEDVTATNGLVHYIDRVLGVPYLSMFEIIRNETTLQQTYLGVRETNLRFTLDPFTVLRPEQNFTFFVPTDEAWAKVPPYLKQRLMDGKHFDALQFVYKRHMLQGQALTINDLRERSYVMMNNQRISVRRRGRWWELYWPHGNQVARIIEGGEIAAINGFMHKIDAILVLDEDLDAGSAQILSDYCLILFTFFFARVFR